MRAMRTAILAAAMMATGCSGLILRSGKDASTISTRDQVRQQFGTPIATGTADGEAFEEYLTRLKIAHEMRSVEAGMIDVYTLGLAEFVQLPAALYELGRYTLRGQTIRFGYDAEGRVTRILLDGKWELLSRSEPVLAIH